MVTHEDFRYWYADNTDADYEDLCRKVLELLENVEFVQYVKGYDAGYAEGVMEGRTWTENE